MNTLAAIEPTSEMAYNYILVTDSEIACNMPNRCLFPLVFSKGSHPTTERSSMKITQGGLNPPLLLLARRPVRHCSFGAYQPVAYFRL